MKYYLSSYKFGNQLDQLPSLLPLAAKIGHIHNARDFTTADVERKVRSQQEEIAQLQQLGFAAEALDLKDYFHREAALRTKLNTLHGVWVSGGNTFVLRQAMRLSGFDCVIHELAQRNDFLYAGYSAGICVLSTSLQYLHLVDNSDDFPYPDCQQPLWQGLGLLDYALLPHYDSYHPESEAIGRTVTYCIEQKLLFKALRDGEVLVMTERDAS
ncbi:Type 1 glutamine amidotransferase-like domain-containing protein [Hymenobacter sp. GOD-10R]|uniref:Type 1 glutamine amidotransferase-like domain-containing protein n=1 Tax=Hymenobacter sp. GOD-10R TaxID=3093922 RepID=UPI002D7A307F|nr:Type 1 glutamine amidotransferase-like domain-containing protein [Hymenobacter sp. GOD-10R]WRQ27116.1 Type 1 glutamine amidotransferase-like domain-containing protein [Hymenobacter sp. GOD-10R]